VLFSDLNVGDCKSNDRTAAAVRNS